MKSTARFRGEVKRETKQVQFRIKVKEINNADEPYLISVAEIISNGRILGICDDFAVKLVALQ